MQLGISTYSFPWSMGVVAEEPGKSMSGKDLLNFAAKKGIRFVQFGDNYPLHLLTPEELANLKKTANDLGIQIQVGTKRLTLKNISDYLLIANFVNAPLLRIIIDDVHYSPTEEEVIDIINNLLPQLGKCNVQLAIENHDRFTAKTLRRIIEATDPEWVGICLDTANSFGAGEGIHEVVAQLGAYTINLHVKDFTIRRVEHNMGFEIHGCIAGEGMLDIPWLVNKISSKGICETAILELWSEAEETIEATILKERNWVEKSIDYLKTVVT
jgi:sugar phosphate isomerase/epimerase